MRVYKSPRDRRQAGASLIEFALVLPIFLALIIGILFYGIAFVAHQAVNYAAESGAEAVVSVDPDAPDFKARAAEQAGARIAGILSFFHGVDGDKTFPLVYQCPGSDDSKPKVSTICVVEGGVGARRVVVSLAPRFQEDLLPGFPQPGFFVTPEFVRASGTAIIAEETGASGG